MTSFTIPGFVQQKLHNDFIANVIRGKIT